MNMTEIVTVYDTGAELLVNYGYQPTVTLSYRSNEFLHFIRNYAWNSSKSNDAVLSFIVRNLSDLNFYEDNFLTNLILSLILKQSDDDMLLFFNDDSQKSKLYTFVRKFLLFLKPTTDLNDSSKHEIFLKIFQILIKLTNCCKEEFKCLEDNGIYENLMCAWRGIADYFKDHFNEIDKNNVNLLETLHCLSTLMLNIPFNLVKCPPAFKGSLIEILKDFVSNEIYLKQNPQLVHSIILKCLICFSNCLAINLNDQLIIKRIDHDLLNQFIKMHICLLHNVDFDRKLLLYSLSQFIKYYVHNFPGYECDIVEIAIENLLKDAYICELFCNDTHIGLKILEKVALICQSDYMTLDYLKVLIEYGLLNEIISGKYMMGDCLGFIQRVLRMLYNISKTEYMSSNVDTLFRELNAYEFFLKKHPLFKHCQLLMLMLFTNLVNVKTYKMLTMTKYGVHQVENKDVINQFSNFVELFAKAIICNKSFADYDFDLSQALANFDKLVNFTPLHKYNLCQLCIENKEVLNYFFGVLENQEKSAISKQICSKLINDLKHSDKDIQLIIKRSPSFSQLLSQEI